MPDYNVERFSPVRARAMAENELMDIEQANRRNALMESAARRQEQQFAMEMQDREAQKQQSLLAQHTDWIKNAIVTARRNPQVIPALVGEAKQRGLLPPEVQTLAPADIEELALKYQVPPEKAPELPADVRSAQYWAEHPDLAEIDRQQRRSSAAVTNINMPVDKAADQAFGKAEGEAYSAILQRGQDAMDKAQSIRALQQNPAITGPTRDVRATAAAFFKDVGVPVSEDTVKQIGNLGQYKATLSQLVLTEQLKQKGPQTESDAKRIQETFGKTTNAGEANKLILDYQLALAEREAVLASVAEEYRAKSGKIDGYRKAVAEYVRATPLAAKNPKSGQLVFWNQFLAEMTKQGMSEERALTMWRTKYGNR